MIKILTCFIGLALLAPAAQSKPVQMEVRDPLEQPGQTLVCKSSEELVDLLMFAYMRGSQDMCQAGGGTWKVQDDGTIACYTRAPE